MNEDKAMRQAIKAKQRAIEQGPPSYVPNIDQVSPSFREV